MNRKPDDNYKRNFICGTSMQGPPDRGMKDIPIISGNTNFDASEKREIIPSPLQHNSTNFSDSNASGLGSSNQNINSGLEVASPIIYDASIKSVEEESNIGGMSNLSSGQTGNKN